MRYHWFIQFSHERKPSLESRRSAPASKLSISSLGARHKLEHKAISPIDVAPALRTIVRRLYRVIIYNNNGPQREKTGSYLPVTGLASTNWVPDWLGRSIKVISRVRACNTQPPWRTWWYAQQPPMNFACNPNEIRARAKRNRKESWRNIISTMITMTMVSFPKFLRKLERRVFRAVSRRNYRRILLLRPSLSVCTPFRARFPPRGGGVFNYYYGNLNHPANGDRAPQPGIIYSQLSLWQRRPVCATSSRVTVITRPWLVQQRLIGCHVSRNLRVDIFQRKIGSYLREGMDPCGHIRMES